MISGVVFGGGSDGLPLYHPRNPHNAQPGTHQTVTDVPNMGKTTGRASLCVSTTPAWTATDREQCEFVTVLAACSIELAKQAINTHENSDTRDNVAYLLQVLGVLCKQSAIISDDPSYAPMIYYERVRTGRAHPDYFFDGLPRSVSIFGAPTTLTLTATNITEITFEDALDDRLNMIDKLETMPIERYNNLCTSNDKLEDLPADVPKPAHVLISRMRSLSSALRRAHPQSTFVQCEHQACKRLFWKHGMSSVSSKNDETDAEYWTVCSSTPKPKYDMMGNRFCSRVCADQWTDEWLQLSSSLQQSDICWECDDSIEDTKASRRVSKAYKKALKRNEMASRCFRGLREHYKTKAKRGGALSKSHVLGELLVFTDRLNVDIGLLYAAQIYIQLPRQRESLALPGAAKGWRLNAPKALRNAMLRVEKLARVGAPDEPIHDLLDPPKFLKTLRSHVLHIFE